METRKVFFLCRDEKEIYRGLTYNDCLKWLHITCSTSWNHALKYEGYSIKETEEQLVS